MKFYRILMLMAGVLLLAGCEKMPSSNLEGRWKPVYASGTYEDAAYIHYFDGPADERGVVPQVYVGKTNPDVKYESTLTLVGYRFFQKDGKDVFTTFLMDTPNKRIYEPLMYRIEDGIIYREMPWGALINDSLDYLDQGSGQFDEGTPITILDNGQLKIGNFTYQRMD